MYLDQPGLLGLWDRMKAVFAGKSDVSKSEQKLSSKGLQLVANGTGITGDNTNFSHLTYDATKSSGMSAGSFTYAKGKCDTISTDDYVPLTTGRDYRISFDLMSDGGNATAYGCILFYDADKKLIEAQHCMYISGSTTKLARDLKKGDTEVYFESLDGWKVTNTRIFNRSIIFWDYANSLGYTYPPETYSRYFHYNLYADDSAVDKAAKKITLSKPWALEEHKAGTPVSQNESGATYKYFGISGTKVPTEWTTYEDVLKGEVDYSGTNVPHTIPPGTAYARPGFLWNYNLSGDQLWMTNLSLGYIDPITEDGANTTLEKLPVWSGYPLDNTQLIRRDNGGIGEWGRVTFLTVWNYIKGKANALYAPKSHTHQVSDITGLSANAADYIVECGVKAVGEISWYCRKWASGRMEAWATIKRFNATTTYDSAEWGYYVKADAVSYPAGLFNATPRVYMTIRGGTFGWGVLSGLGSKDKTPDMYLYRPTESPGYDVYFDLYAFGKWK